MPFPTSLPLLDDFDTGGTNVNGLTRLRVSSNTLDAGSTLGTRGP